MRIASLIPVLALLATLSVVATPARAQLAFLVINEVDPNTPTLPVNDDKEFIELYDGGIGGQSLVGYTIVFYNGAGNANPCSPGTTSYFAIDLTGSTDVNGYYLIGNVGVIPAPAQTWPTSTLQNGSDAVALYFGTPAAGFPGGTAVTAVNLVDAVTYDNSTFPACGLITVLTPGQPSVNENANNNVANDSFGRCPNGLGGAFITSGWQVSTPSPGASNTCSSNVYAMSITQGGCGGLLTVSVVNAAAFAELYNLISLLCSSPPGNGPLFGLAVGPGSGDPFQEVFLSLGTQPFHVNADVNGNYSVSFQTSPCPGLALSVEGVSIQAVGYSIQAVTQTTTCISVTI